MTRKQLLYGIIVVLTLALLSMTTLYMREKNRADELDQAIRTPAQLKIIDFGDQFVTKVLKADKEVDFDTRLKLENDVRDIDDKDMLDQWQKFTAAKSEAEAQTEVKNLLSLIFTKLK